MDWAVAIGPSKQTPSVEGRAGPNQAGPEHGRTGRSAR